MGRDQIRYSRLHPYTWQMEECHFEGMDHAGNSVRLRPLPAPREPKMQARCREKNPMKRPKYEKPTPEQKEKYNAEIYKAKPKTAK